MGSPAGQPPLQHQSSINQNTKISLRGLTIKHPSSFKMFKNTIYVVLALSAALTAMAAPVSAPVADLIRKDAEPQWSDASIVGGSGETL